MPILPFDMKYGWTLSTPEKDVEHHEELDYDIYALNNADPGLEYHLGGQDDRKGTRGGWFTFTMVEPLRLPSREDVKFWVDRKHPAWCSGWRFGGVCIEKN